MRIPTTIIILLFAIYSYSQQFEFIEQFEGNCAGVELDSNYAFLNSGRNIHILDYSNPEEPFIINTFYVEQSYPIDITSSNGYLYISSGTSGFYLYDISNPLQPEFKSRVDWPDCEYAMEAYSLDSTLAIIEGNSVSLFNVINPSTPVFLSRIDFPVNNEEAYAFVNNIIYGFEISENTNWDYYLRAYDISDPVNPQLANELKLDEWPGQKPNDMKVHNEQLFIAFNDTVKVYDITMGDTTIFLSEFNVIDSINKMKIREDVLYAYSDKKGINLFNIADSYSPEYLGLYEQSIPISKFEVDDNLLFTSKGFDGLKLEEIDDLNNPELLYSYDQTDYVKSIEIQGNIAYKGMQESGLQVVDIETPLYPIDLGNIDSLKRVREIEYYQNYLYCRIDDEYFTIHIVDVNDLINPIKVNEINSELFINDFKISNGILYLMVGTEILKFYDLTDPATPEELASQPLNGHRIAIEDDLLVVTYAIEGGPYQSAMKTYKIEENYSLISCDDIILGEYLVYNPKEIEIKLPYIYIGAVSGIVSTKTNAGYNITICDEIIFNGMSTSTYAMNSNDSYIFLAGYYAANSQVLIIDISDPYNLLSKSIETHCFDIGIKQNMLFLAEGQNGYSIYGDLSVTIPNQPELSWQSELDIFPNPFSGHLNINFNGKLLNNSRLRIFNSNSQLIAEIDLSGKSHTKLYTENYKNGIYFFELTENNQVKNGKAIKIK